MSDKHTPGPWAYRPSRFAGKTVRLKREHWAFGTIDTREGLGLAFKSEANARLIAAAPELLALAEQYASECLFCMGTGVYQFCMDATAKNGSPCKACAEIRAVIAKARGEV